MKKNSQITFPALGTINTISVFGYEDETVLNRAADRVRELHHRLSAFSTDSDLYALSAAAGRNFVKVHQDTFHLVQEAKKYAEQTSRAFDPTIRPLVELWDIGGRKHEVPDEREICRAMCLLNIKNIELDRSAGSIMLRQPHMALDLGGIAKGYAADEVRRILTENGVEEAIINLGGTVIVLGKAQALGIQHPDLKTGTPACRFWLSKQAAVTSGSYEKCFTRSGRRYHHLLDPRTGYPAESGLKSVTLIGSSALPLDALSTAVFVLGAEAGSRIVKRHNLQAVYMTTDNQILVTAGLKDAVILPEKLRGAV